MDDVADEDLWLEAQARGLIPEDQPFPGTETDEMPEEELDPEDLEEEEALDPSPVTAGV